MDYDLSHLGTRDFEHMTQALALKEIGPKLTIFGDGPDGGREATWKGVANAAGALNSWDGYGVFQAKYKVHSSEPAENLVWIKASLRAELLAWSKVDSNRQVKPDYLVFVTNVRLSASPGNGRDAAEAYLRELIEELKLQIADFRIWDYYDLVALLDNNRDVRSRYMAFLASGDLISKLLENFDDVNKSMTDALTAHAARSLSDELLLNLTQAGVDGDSQITIDKVFVDLPADLPDSSWVLREAPENVVGDDETDDALGVQYEWRGVTSYLLNGLNGLVDSEREDGGPAHKTVLIGGPGQGKSTVTQWLAQMYRAEFLRGSPLASNGDIAAAIDKISQRSTELGLPTVAVRRWPVRVTLSDLADHLAENPTDSLLHYLAQNVSRRSSYDLTSANLRKWLSVYPWVLLVDGLDEVPTSSNRAQVMSSLRDFFLDVSVLKGNVAVVATTRPQGYGEEFSPKEYLHLHLDALDMSQALEYAERLVNVRQGSGTANAEKVLGRLRRASAERHTQNLFESPLQVTILEVLLEKLGKPPSDRSRLYSQYYRVITNREQEKSGGLSELLQIYESDIDYLHREIGHVLQQRSSVAGDAKATISLTEFHEFIADRFKKQGHPEDQVESLVLEFSLLVTDRLVFLAKIQSDRIGFELRSLQEFMASEHIVHLPESVIIPEILKIAAVPFWRNVVLFAIGKIFAHKEHLRARVVLLCGDLNVESPKSRLLLPGSRLALDVLRDGSSLSHPQFSRALAEIALRMLQKPEADRADWTVVAENSTLNEELWRELESLATAPADVWINRALILSNVYALDTIRVDRALSALIDAVSPEMRTQLAILSFKHLNMVLARALERVLDDIDPRAVVSASTRANWLMGGVKRRSAPEWLRALAAVYGAQSADSAVDASGLLARFVPLGGDAENWEWLAGRSVDSSWKTLSLIARFALEPSTSALADVVESLDWEWERSLPRLTPWPITSVVSQLRDLVTSGSAEDCRRLVSGAIRAGQFGDEVYWRAVQETWVQGESVDFEFVRGTPPRSASQVVTVVPEVERFFGRCANFTLSGVGGRGDKRLLELIHVMIEKSPEASFWLQIGMFVASVAARRLDIGHDDVVDENAAGFEGLPEQIFAARGSHPMRSSWMNWLDLGAVDSTNPSSENLAWLGSAGHLIGALESQTAQTLVERSLEPGVSFTVAVPALVSEPVLVVQLARKDLEDFPNRDERGGFGVLFEALELIAAPEESIVNGLLDGVMRRLDPAPRGQLDLGWFSSVLQDWKDTRSEAIAVRAVEAWRGERPLASRQIVEALIARGEDSLV